MKLSIRTKYTLLIAAVMGTMILILCLANTLYLEKYYISAKTDDMMQVYENVDLILKNGSISEETTYLRLRRIFENANISALIGTSDQAIPYRFGYEDRMEQQMMQVALGQHGEQARLIEYTEKYVVYHYYDTQLQSTYILCFGFLEGGASCFLRSSLPSIRDSALISARFTWMTGLILVLFSMVFVFLVSSRISRPIVRLAHIADRMSHLDFSVKYEDEREDEIDMLGHSMNDMSRELERTICDLRQANVQLKKDIDEKVKVEEIRKEFIANVSHELKTPIALIQGYAEGLLDGMAEDPENLQYYCEVIVDEAGKMNQLVRKLLTLNQIESGINVVEPEDFDMCALIQSVLHSFQIVLSQKDVTLEFDPQKICMVRADESMMEEVVRNYISNALNHIAGQRRLTITTDETEQWIKVSVFNTGSSIPEEDLEQVWQKFFKVDKAHTREYGGNGIGLSIVKAVMDSHGGTCGVYNTEDGVCFWFALNKLELPAVINSY